jgi:hypothetical protein
MKKELEIEPLYDFGFCAVNESELEAVQTAETTKKKTDLLYNAILPLLSRLKENPDRDYIFWPNRLPKVEEFEEKLRKIYEM